jgi:hypothetical protein
VLLHGVSLFIQSNKSRLWMLVTEFIFLYYRIIYCDIYPFLAYFPFFRSHSGTRTGVCVFVREHAPAHVMLFQFLDPLTNFHEFWY